jgi:LysR family transcriptional regulator, flagellar master operon regulator
MDTVLARTFLEIVSTGSFQRAAEVMHVSQTTVSARVRSLESQMGRPLFVRNKAGASLTRAGQSFLRYAPTLVQMWERARHDVAIPEGHRAVLAIGAELSLWNPLLLNWLLWMKSNAPDIALRTQVGSQERLTRSVAEGLLDIAVVYAPHNLPGLKVEQLFDEKLVMVTTNIDQPMIDDDGYVYVDWGPDFETQHGTAFPKLTNPSLLVGLGLMGLNYILKVGGSGYFRMSSVRPHIASGRLSLVPDAPEFQYPAFVVYPVNNDNESLEPALKGLHHIADEAQK